MITRFYIGVDVSKATLDWAVTDGKKSLLQTQSVNSKHALRQPSELLRRCQAL